MEIDSVSHRLTDVELNRRRTNNLCMYCGQDGHFSRNCPVRAQSQRGRSSGANISAISEWENSEPQG